LDVGVILERLDIRSVLTRCQKVSDEVEGQDLFIYQSSLTGYSDRLYPIQGFFIRCDLGFNEGYKGQNTDSLVVVSDKVRVLGM